MDQDFRETWARFKDVLSRLDQTLGEAIGDPSVFTRDDDSPSFTGRLDGLTRNLLPDFGKLLGDQTKGLGQNLSDLATPFKDLLSQSISPALEKLGNASTVLAGQFDSLKDAARAVPDRLAKIEPGKAVSESVEALRDNATKAARALGSIDVGALLKSSFKTLLPQRVFAPAQNQTGRRQTQGATPSPRKPGRRRKKSRKSKPSFFRRGINRLQNLGSLVPKVDLTKSFKSLLSNFSFAVPSQSNTSRAQHGAGQGTTPHVPNVLSHVDWQSLLRGGPGQVPRNAYNELIRGSYRAFFGRRERLDSALDSVRQGAREKVVNSFVTDHAKHFPGTPTAAGVTPGQFPSNMVKAFAQGQPAVKAEQVAAAEAAAAEGAETLAAGFGRLIPAVGVTIVAFDVAVKGLRQQVGKAYEQLEKDRKFNGWNALYSTGFTMLSMNDFTRRMQTGDATQHTGAMLIAGIDRLNQSLQPFEKLSTNLGNVLGSAATNISSYLLDHVANPAINFGNNLLEGSLDILDGLRNAIEKIPGVPGEGDHDWRKDAQKALEKQMGAADAWGNFIRDASKMPPLRPRREIKGARPKFR